MNKHLQMQENSNRQPTPSVPELMSIYLFGQLNGHFKKRHIYDFINNYWREYFPALPSYQAFSQRLNLLENHFHLLFGCLVAQIKAEARHRSDDHLIDSMPVMLAQGSKSKRFEPRPPNCQYRLLRDSTD
ncbi:MAG: hypothetical protein M3Q33_04550 [Acidobacteriota bacterium]|nr:hypothetical protein [Acidobacteriota bacterium]